jgi:hypothetical protein
MRNRPRRPLATLSVAAVAVSFLACGTEQAELPATLIGQWQATGVRTLINADRVEFTDSTLVAGGETSKYRFVDSTHILLDDELVISVDISGELLTLADQFDNRQQFTRITSNLSEGRAPRLRGVDDGEAQKQTVTDVRNIGTAMFSWLTDEVSAAAAGQSQTQRIDIAQYSSITRQALQGILVPQYLQTLPEADGWGHSYDFYLNTSNPLAPNVMSIRSPGRDGRFSATTYSIGPFAAQSFDEDIVWSDGFFVRWPQTQ